MMPPFTEPTVVEHLQLVGAKEGNPIAEIPLSPLERHIIELTDVAAMLVSAKPLSGDLRSDHDHCCGCH